MSGNELPKVIDKSPADIEAAIIVIQSSNLSSGTKEFAISCIKLAVWLPKALLEQKIKLSNLRKLIFGFGGKRKKKSNHEGNTEKSTDQEKENDNHIEKSNEQNDSSEAKTSNSLATAKKGHGRLAHSAYTNTIEHQLSITNLKASDFCPLDCGGKLYNFEPGVIVRVRGQNIAAVHKYWIQKLRCALCGHIISADIPSHVGRRRVKGQHQTALRFK